METQAKSEEPLYQVVEYPGSKSVIYEKPNFKSIFFNVPRTAKKSVVDLFKKDSILPLTVITASTLFLIEHDQQIYDDTVEQGKKLSIESKDNTKTILKVGDINILRVPTDKGSALYFLGDGWMHMGIAGGFLFYGVSSTNYRAINTSYQLVHGMIVSTIFNQALKRSFGRETPNERSEPGGKWKPFPSTPAYNKNTAVYDAMPSGHVMTATLSLTIINENYPEYSNYSLPIGGLLISALAWQMVNNGVHWAADYPLAIGMGVFYGKLIANNWEYRKTNGSKIGENQIHYLPFLEHGSMGLQAVYEF